MSMVADSRNSIPKSNWLTSKDHDDWDGNCTWHFESTTTYSAKLTPPILAKNKQLQGWFGPNDMCKWFQIASEALQSQNGFIAKVCKGCDGNCTWIFHQNTPLSARLTPKFDQKRTIWWLLWAKLHVYMIIDCCRSIPKAKIGSQTLIVKPGMGIVHGILSQPQHFLLSWPPIFDQKRAAPELIWPKLYVRMVAEYCRSTPKSMLVHKKGL